MMQESGTEATSNGPANQNGAASVEGGARDARPRSVTTPSTVDIAAADLIHLQQHQVNWVPLFIPVFINPCEQQSLAHL